MPFCRCRRTRASGGGHPHVLPIRHVAVGNFLRAFQYSSNPTKFAPRIRPPILSEKVSGLGTSMIGNMDSATNRRVNRNPETAARRSRIGAPERPEIGIANIARYVSA